VDCRGRDWWSAVAVVEAAAVVVGGGVVVMPMGGGGFGWRAIMDDGGWMMSGGGRWRRGHDDGLWGVLDGNWARGVGTGPVRAGRTFRESDTETMRSTQIPPTRDGEDLISTAAHFSSLACHHRPLLMLLLCHDGRFR
jgi:hypothetical protein